MKHCCSPWTWTLMSIWRLTQAHTPAGTHTHIPTEECNKSGSFKALLTFLFIFPVVMTIFPEPNIRRNGLTHGCHLVSWRVNRIVCSQDVPGNVEMWSYPNEDRVHFPRCPCSALLQSSEPKGIAEGQDGLLPEAPMGRGCERLENVPSGNWDLV